MPIDTNLKKFQQSTKLITPSKYQNIGVGPDTERNYEPQYGQLFEGSNKFLRAYSPFTLSLILPDIYATYKQENKSPTNISSEVDTPSSYSRIKTNPFIYGEAGRTFDSFSKAQANKKNILQGEYSKFLGGFNNFIVNEKFIANGKEITYDGFNAEPTITNKDTALDIATQIAEILNTPPITLLINPESLSINYNKIQQYSERGRYGYIFQAWGEEQPKLSVSGRIGAFISGGSIQVATGLHPDARNESASWQNLMNLLVLYKNNGYIYDRIGRSNAMHAIGSISLEYDQWIYEGNMRSFEYELNEENILGGVSFSFEFEVNRMYDISNPPQYLTKYSVDAVKSIIDYTKSVGSNLNNNTQDPFSFESIAGEENLNNITGFFGVTTTRSFVESEKSSQENKPNTKPKEVPAGTSGFRRLF